MKFSTHVLFLLLTLTPFLTETSLAQKEKPGRSGREVERKRLEGEAARKSEAREMARVEDVASILGRDVRDLSQKEERIERKLNERSGFTGRLESEREALAEIRNLASRGNQSAREQYLGLLDLYSSGKRSTEDGVGEPLPTPSQILATLQGTNAWANERAGINRGRLLQKAAEKANSAETAMSAEEAFFAVLNEARILSAYRNSCR